MIPQYFEKANGRNLVIMANLDSVPGEGCNMAFITIASSGVRLAECSKKDGFESQRPGGCD
jgi:hypothetical protein